MAAWLPLLASLALSTAVAAAPAPKQPNILLVFPDELRYDWGGLQANPYYLPGELPLKTPNFDRLAAYGTRFTKAFVPSPVCAPSRACLASGREYDHAGQGRNGLSTSPDKDGDYSVEIPTFFQALQQAGYWTMVSGRDDLTKKTGPGPDGMYHTRELGFNQSTASRCAGANDVTFGQTVKDYDVVHEPFGVWLNSSNCSVDTQAAAKYGSSNCFDVDFLRYKELLSRSAYNGVAWYGIPDALPLPQIAYQDDWIGRMTLQTLEEKPEDTPWFMWVNHQAPHPPMDIPQDMIDTVANRGPWPSAYNCTSTQAGDLCDQKSQYLMRRNYAAKIERVDYWLGQYMAWLDDNGELENTIVCLTSDHGEMLGDRATTAKEKPWQSAVSVPLICQGPNIGAGRVVSFPVTTMDLAATFIDLAGGSKPDGMTSQTLVPLLRGDQPLPEYPPRRILYSGLDNFRTVVEYVNKTHVFKFFCCTGPCPGSAANDENPRFPKFSDEYHLYNIANYESNPHARFEPPEMDLKDQYPTVVANLASLLPPRHEEHNAGYAWKGCKL